MGLFDRFKSNKAPTKQGLTAGELNAKAIALGDSNRLQEAIQCYDKALEIDPQFLEAWVGKGAAIGALGNPDKAIQCYDKALEIDPRYAKAWRNKGTTLAAVGRRNLRLFGRTQEAVGRHALGTLQEAIQCYDKALEINPKDTIAQKLKRELLEEFRAEGIG
jgi:tetratricopeptide (TPR) repeat protein